MIGTIRTDAWVLKSDGVGKKATLQKEIISIEGLLNDEVLVKPLYGCMEGNIVHALQLEPENIFLNRGEEQIVPGNSGVVLVEEVGSDVTTVEPGDICIYFCNGIQDDYGYPMKISAYDKPGSMGVFAKQLKLNQYEVMKVPSNSRHSLPEWAAFSLKYVTAWSNWKTAYSCWKVQMPDVPPEETFVFGWGGGVTMAELDLAARLGCKSYMMTSKKERIQMLKEYNITGVDRSSISTDKDFQEYVNEVTGGKGASIFIDNIGRLVYKKTIRALGRQGVIATSGWKAGSMIPILRANECINRHIHVFTHYATYKEGKEAMQFAEEHNWMPPISEEEYHWDEIPEMLTEYEKGNITSWFPIYKINEV